MTDSVMNSLFQHSPMWLCLVYSMQEIGRHSEHDGVGGLWAEAPISLGCEVRSALTSPGLI